MNSLSFLVVDDHMLIRKTLTQYLNELGHIRIDTAVNGKDALEKINVKLLTDSLYNVVFLDIKMPVMDGIELLKTCRENRELDKTAFVILSGECEKQKVIDAINAGVTSYIVKPISQHALAEKLKLITKWLSNNGEAV